MLRPYRHRQAVTQVVEVEQPLNRDMDMEAFIEAMHYTMIKKIPNILIGKNICTTTEAATVHRVVDRHGDIIAAVVVALVVAGMDMVVGMAGEDMVMAEEDIVMAEEDMGMAAEGMGRVREEDTNTIVVVARVVAVVKNMDITVAAEH